MQSERSSVHKTMEYDLISRFPNQYSQEHVDLYNSKEKNNWVSKLTMFGIASLVAIGGNVSGFNSNLTDSTLYIKDKYFSTEKNEKENKSEEISTNNSPHKKDFGLNIYEYLTAASIFTISYISLKKGRKVFSQE